MAFAICKDRNDLIQYWGEQGELKYLQDHVPIPDLREELARLEMKLLGGIHRLYIQLDPSLPNPDFKEQRSDYLSRLQYEFHTHCIIPSTPSSCYGDSVIRLAIQS